MLYGALVLFGARSLCLPFPVLATCSHNVISCHEGTRETSLGELSSEGAVIKDLRCRKIAAKRPKVKTMQSRLRLVETLDWLKWIIAAPGFSWKNCDCTGSWKDYFLMDCDPALLKRDYELVARWPRKLCTRYPEQMAYRPIRKAEMVAWWCPNGFLHSTLVLKNKPHDFSFFLTKSGTRNWRSGTLA